MRSEIKTKKVLVGLAGLILAALLIGQFKDSDSSDESLATRFSNWWNRLTGKDEQKKTLVVASSGTETATNFKNIVRLTTTGLFTIPAGTNWINVINKGATNNATIAFGSGSASKLYVDQATYIEKKNETDSLPSATVNGNGEEVLIEYSKNA